MKQVKALLILSLMPFAETHDRVSYLQWSSKHDRLISSGPFQLNIGPAFDKYMEWGFTDGSVRFYTLETKKVSIPSYLNHKKIC